MSSVEANARQSGGEDEILLSAAVPELYRRNAFRVAGLPVSATEGDRKRRRQELAVAERIGLAVDSRSEGYLPVHPPPDPDEVRRALDRLRNPVTRLIDEFFWFWPGDSDCVDDPALDLLKSHQVNEARDIWFEREQNGALTKASRHNLAVLSHVAALDLEHKAQSRALSEEETRSLDVCWKEAYSRWRQLQNDEWFWSHVANRIRQLDDPRLTTGAVRRLRQSLPKALLSINARLAYRAAKAGAVSTVRRHVQYMRSSGLDTELVAGSVYEAVTPAREHLRLMCATALEQAETDPAGGGRAADRLLEEAYPLLQAIGLILQQGDAIRENAYDGVARAARECIVAYGNAVENWRRCIQFSELALPLAVRASTRERIEEDLGQLFMNLCGEMVEQASETARDADTVIATFLSEARPLLERLDFLLPSDSTVRQQAHEHVVTAARNCIIAYGQQTENWERCLRFCLEAMPLAANEATRMQLEADIATLRTLCPASAVSKRGTRRTASSSQASRQSARPSRRPAVAETPARTSRYAIASLVLGIFGFFTCGLGAIVGIGLGIAALESIGRSDGRLKGKGMAIAGILLSWLSLGGCCSLLFSTGSGPVITHTSTKGTL